MATWPVDLPDIPAFAGYREQAPDGSERSTVSGGPENVRRRSNAIGRPFGFELVLTDAQIVALDDFYITDCAHGALPFDWETPRTIPDEGARVAIEMRWEGPPSYVPLGAGLYRTGFRMEMLKADNVVKG